MPSHDSTWGDYCRVYHTVIDDPKFETIYPDDHHLATWLRLLMIADQAWPASAHLPVRVNRRSLGELVSVGLIDLLQGERYRIHGLDPERGRRKTEQRNGGVVRVENAVRGPNGRFLPNSSGGPALDTSGGPPANQLSRAEPSKDEQSLDEQNARVAGFEWEEPEAEALTWLAKHGCYIKPGNGYHQQLVLVVERHGINAVIGMLDRLAAAGIGQGDIKGFLFGAVDALNAQVRPSLREVERDDRRAEVLDNHTRYVTDQVMRRRREWFANTGQWEEGWGPKPEGLSA